VRSFLTIARQRKAEKRAVALTTIVDSAIELLSYGLRTGGVAVEREYEDSLPEVFADGDQVQQIIVNLLVNASQALEDVDGRREIRVAIRAGADDTVRLVIADNGRGVSKELAARIFDPFFTTKPQGSGTGIGLSVSRGLAQAQGGRLSLQESPLGGAAFELTLPVARGHAESAVEPSAKPSPRKVADAPEVENRRAIVIDDETEIAVLLAEILRNAGYVCDVATSGREGQTMIAARAGGYDAIVCDLRMPDIDGPKLFSWVESTHPALAERTLFVTGDTLGPHAAKFLARCNRPVLEKPFVPGDVVRLVGEFPPRAGMA
jgi:CheY-like chemotaxis protein